MKRPDAAPLSVRAAVALLLGGEGAVDDRTIAEAATMAPTLLRGPGAIDTLIELASSHASPSVRRSAMFWLGRSGDLRATAFFDQMLRRTV